MARILLTGASGLIGSHLLRALIQRGDTVVALSRHPFASGHNIVWKAGDVTDVTFVADAMQNVDAVVNLAGASIAQRWTDAHKQAIMQSREQTTRALCAAMKQVTREPRVLVNASAVGYYGCHSSAMFDEQSLPGTGFLAEVCQRWEAAARHAEAAGVRTVLVRIGVVLAKEGGALPKLALPVKTFVGGTLGDGRQWMSWIHIDDLVNLLLLALDNDSLHGPVNGVAPEAVRAAAMTQAIGKVLHRPVWLPVPGFALKMLLGQMAEEALLGGQQAVPTRARAAGFVYKFPTLLPALENLLEGKG